VPAAEAKKAEGASDDTRRTPRPPFLTGSHGLHPLDIGEVGVGDGAGCQIFVNQHVHCTERLATCA